MPYCLQCSERFDPECSGEEEFCCDDCALEYSQEDEDNDQPTTELERVTRSPQIMPYGYNPRRWDYARKTFEKNHQRRTESDSTYLGVELEMNFAGAACESHALRLAAQYFPNVHFWSRDNSVTTEGRDSPWPYGAELVFAPMTLVRFRELRLREFCKAAREIGCNAFDSGRCGLHVHVSCSAFTANQYRLARLFFAANHDFLVAYSLRSNSQLSAYARIPRLDGGRRPDRSRYDAIANRGETIELRLFRSKLDADYIRARVEFAACLALWTRRLGTIEATCTGSVPAFAEFAKKNGFHLLHHSLTLPGLPRRNSRSDKTLLKQLLHMAGQRRTREVEGAVSYLRQCSRRLDTGTSGYSREEILGNLDYYAGVLSTLNNNRMRVEI